MPIWKTKLCAALFAASAAVPTALGQPNLGGEHVTIKANTDFSTMHVGQSGFLAIDIVVDDTWHTYWPGVSDTGYGISFEIDAPDSIEFKDPIWPSPERYLLEGGILDHTYEGTETVLYPFVIKEDAELSEVTFKIESSFLVCDKDVCLPGKGSAATSFQVVSNGGAAVKSRAHGTIHGRLEVQPKPLNTSSYGTELTWGDSSAVLTIKNASRIEFYPDNECTEIVDLIKDGAADGNRLEIDFAESDNKRLSGRIRIKTVRGEQFFDINEVAP